MFLIISVHWSWNQWNEISCVIINGTNLHYTFQMRRQWALRWTKAWQHEMNPFLILPVLTRNWTGPLLCIFWLLLMTGENHCRFYLPTYFFCWWIDREGNFIFESDLQTVFAITLLYCPGHFIDRHFMIAQSSERISWQKIQDLHGSLHCGVF